MRILGIETATNVCAAAIVEDGKVLVERQLRTPYIHSEQLIPLIDECLQITHTEIKQLDGIAVSIGPGSFTGLRIGVSVAKGLAYSNNKPLIGIPTLRALAWNAILHGVIKQTTSILPMLDARRDEVYCALYGVQGNNLDEKIQPCALPLSELVKLLPENEEILVVGDGVEKFQVFEKQFANSKSTMYIYPTKDSCICTASSIALLGESKLFSTGGDDLVALEPLYVKDFYTLVKTQHSRK